MEIWVVCTRKNGGPIFVNLSTAMSARWNEDDKCTIIAYPGGGEDFLQVREKPEAILGAGNLDFRKA